MRYRLIPGTHLKVSEIGFRVGSLDGSRWDTLSEKEAFHLLRYSLDRGINFFDTANVYGNGRAEALLGAALRDERDRVVLATKFGYDYAPSQAFSKSLKAMKNFKPSHLQHACEESLRRLRTDHIDLYQIHHPDLEEAASEDIAEELEKLRRQGKVIAWGVALGPGSGWVEEGKFFLAFREAQAIQMATHLLDRESRDMLLREARSRQACVIASSPIPEGFDKIDDLKFLDQGKSRGLSHAAVKFLLKKQVIASVLLEMDSEEKINEFAVTCECLELSEEEMRLVEEYCRKNREAVERRPWQMPLKERTPEAL